MTEETQAPEGWSRFEDEGFIDLVGPLYERRAEGLCRAFGFHAQRKHANLIGLVHGGMLMTLAGRALGVASWDAADGRPCVTIQFDMQFVSAASWASSSSFSRNSSGLHHRWSSCAAI